jgi:enoyl-CoA hydratase
MDSELVTRVEGALLRITLNRPQAMNALSIGMVSQLGDILRGVDDEGYSAVLIDGAGERGFCGGGDVKQLSACSAEDARHFLNTEYAADQLVGAATTPIVTFMSGMTMGGGIGVGAYASHRVVTESTVMAMPETRIGFSPDVGANYLLARAPGALGEYLAVSGARFGAADALEMNFADCFVQSEKLPALALALADGASPTEILPEFASPAPAPELPDHRDWIDECFSRDSIVDAIEALEAHPSEAARSAAAEIRTLSPVAVAVSFWAVRLARRDETHAAVFERDKRVMMALLEEFDGREGVRALLIDKDLQPRWNPARIEDVTVAQLVQILGAEVLELVAQNRV